MSIIRGIFKQNALGLTAELPVDGVVLVVDIPMSAVESARPGLEGVRDR